MGSKIVKICRKSSKKCPKWKLGIWNVKFHKSLVPPIYPILSARPYGEARGVIPYGEAREGGGVPHMGRLGRGVGGVRDPKNPKKPKKSQKKSKKSIFWPFFLVFGCFWPEPRENMGKMVKNGQKRGQKWSKTAQKQGFLGVSGKTSKRTSAPYGTFWPQNP